MFGNAWFSRAETLRDLGRYPEAEASYRRASELMPDGWRADIMLGLLYSKRMGRPAEAKPWFESAFRRLQLYPTDTGHPYLMLAQAFDEAGDLPNCWRSLQEAAKFTDTHAEAVQHLQEMAR
jgi:tetratricopeptide (TPR) repeat protein